MEYEWVELIKVWLKMEGNMRKLYLIEGVPGSGKTTFARMLGEELRKTGQEVHLYLEGDLHPADLGWCACMTQEEYYAIYNQYPQYREDFEKNKTVWNDDVILAYTKVENLNEEMYSYFESKELYDGRRENELFCGVHESRWQKFGEEATGLNIFECSLLQNAINELLLFRCAEEEAITEYINKLLKAVQTLNPVILYLDVEAEDAIERAAKERVDSDGTRVWENRVAEYIENSPYGKRKGLRGTGGMLQYFRERKQLELRILETLTVVSYRIPITIEQQSTICNEVIQKLCCEVADGE